LEALAHLSTLDRDTLQSQLTHLGLDKLADLARRAITHKSDRFAHTDAEASEVEAGWQHAVLLHENQVGLERSLLAGQRLLSADPSERALADIVDLARTRAVPEGER